MIDIRLLRGDFDVVATNLARRGIDQATLALAREFDERRRALITTGDELRAQQRTLSRQLGRAQAEEREQLLAEMRDLSAQLTELTPAQSEAQAELDALLARIPNLPHPKAPDGFTEEDAVEVERFGQIPVFEFPARDHVEIGEALGIIDIPRGVKVAGSRFAFLKGQAVWLELALVRYALDRVEQAGFVPVLPPVLTRSEPLFGTGFLPDAEEQLYHIPSDDLYLVGTSEVPLAGMHMDEILVGDDLPVRYAGFSTCFRREAGTYGKDTRGMFRMHQFDKVEMFSFARPDQSDAEHERLVGLQRSLLEGLGLHGRIVDIAVGDLGASAARKFDCEAWLPGQQAYRELTSASNCTDYQARRLRCRYRTGAGETEMVHTLNGTACAIGRTMIAVVETHQRSDGAVAVPPALQPYLGLERIG